MRLALFLSLMGLLVPSFGLAGVPRVSRSHAAALEIAAAERAFAEETARAGLSAGFVRWAAREAVVLRPDPVNARAFYERRAIADRALSWRPYRIAASADGTLGFDTGPWIHPEGDRTDTGWFLTIWSRQPEGGWRWLLDHGYEGGPTDLGKDGRLDLVEAAPAFPGKPEADPTAAMIRVEDRLFARSSGPDGVKAWAGVLAPDAWVAGRTPGPARDAPGRRRALSERPKGLTFERLGASAAASGDLGYSFGRARWREGESPREARFVHVWRRDRRGWRLIMVTLTPI